MSVFHQSDSKTKISPIWIVLIVVILVLCCCCAAAVIFYAASNGHPFGIGKKAVVLPLYLTLRTWL